MNAINRLEKLAMGKPKQLLKTEKNRVGWAALCGFDFLKHRRPDSDLTGDVSLRPPLLMRSCLIARFMRPPFPGLYFGYNPIILDFKYNVKGLVACLTKIFLRHD